MRLTILDIDSPNFHELSSVDIDDWASLRAAIPGKALFNVPGGMLVVNIDDATAPHPQVYSRSADGRATSR